MKKLLSFVLTTLALCNLQAEPLPFNPGEVLIPNGGSSQWFTSGQGHSKIKTFYSDVTGFKAAYYDKSGNGQFTLGRKDLALDCEGFDQFVLWFNNSGTTPVKFQLTVETDSGEKKSPQISVVNKYDLSFTELAVDLEKSKKLKSFSISITYENPGRNSNTSYLFGLILRNSRQFAGYMQHLERYSHLKWEGLLQDESYKPQYKPLYNLCFSNQQLEDFREKYPDLYKNRQLPPAPEQLISDNMAVGGGASRAYTYARVLKAYGHHALVYQIGPATAFAGLVAKNKRFLRMAARYALSSAAMGWDEKPTSNLVGQGVTSAFAPAAISESVALTLDMAGEMLTKKGRNYVLKALMLKGLAPITYSMWARSYAFKMNQGMVFLRGKMASLLIFDKVWPRVTPDLENCKNQMDECLNNVFKPDGSYMESFGYMGYTVANAVIPYSMYAHVKGMKLSEVLPENLAKSGAFAEICASTSKNPQRVITGFGQCRSWAHMRPTRAAFMAYGAPESFWVNLYHKISDRDKAQWRRYYFWGLLFNEMDKAVKDLKEVKRRDLIVLKNSGLTCGCRLDKTGNVVKIVLVGDAYGMGKKHHDVGSFTLEYAGDIYAMDMPFYAGIYDGAQYHNMLVAVDEKGELTDSIPYTDGRIHDNKKARNSMRPAADGNAQKFHCKINASNSWEKKYFEQWLRTIDSPNPNELTITDEYTLGKSATGAAFIWNTFKDVKVEDQTITLTGEYGSLCVITVPEYCKIELDEFNPGTKTLKGMDLPDTHKCTRIIIRKPGKAGEENQLTVKVKLFEPDKN